MSKAFRLPGRPRRQEGQLRQAVRPRLRLHRRGRPEHRHHHRRRRGAWSIDTQATPVMAQDVIRRIREVTDKPIKYVVLIALPRGARARRVGATAPQQIIASQDTYDLIVERGEADMESEIEPLPAPVPRRRKVPGPDLADARPSTSEMTLWLGKLEVSCCSSAAATPRATPSSGCRRRRCCSPATWSSSTPRRTAGDAYFKRLAGDARRPSRR